MIFGRKKADPVPPDPDDADEKDETDDIADDDALDDEDEPSDEEPAELDPWVAFDSSRDWRDDGPFDIDEVDLGADDVQRVDLGTLILTPEKGMNIKLVANAETKQVQHVVVENGPQSAMQITVFAAPATEDFRADIREDIVAHTENAKVVDMAEGPFGTELRRVIALTDDQGREGFAPLRDWLIAGPRWVLNVRLIGQAALDSANEAAASEFEEFVHNIIVRRGDVAMVPGSVVPLVPPETA